MDYYRVLKAIHAQLAPQTYLEIGVRHGESWCLAGDAVQSVGIDPAPDIRHEPAGKAELFAGTSDQFFAQYPPSKVFSGQAVDLAFIDGMHLFEFALRDFTNLERYCRQDSVILVHDCLPIDQLTSARERTTSVWSGDVWKLIVLLQRYRPDLQVTVLDTAPTGLAFITNLDPTSTLLAERYQEIEAAYLAMEYTVLGEGQQKRSMLNVCPADAQHIQRLCARPAAAATPRPAKKRPPRSSSVPKKLGVLLCYNDADVLADVIDHLLVNDHDLLIWDHGSTDATPAILRHYRDALVGHQRIGREVDFYGLYPAMSKTLMADYAGKYDWISWPDQDEFLEGANRRSSYAEQVHRAYAEGADWIEFNNLNFWWTHEDRAVIQSPVRRIRHYGIFPDCSPRIRSWRAAKTNVREFNHNPIDGHKHPVKFNLRHYPMRSEAQMQRRIFRDRAALQRGPLNYHYNNMAKHAERLVVPAASLHFDDGVAELNLACRFDWRTIYGYGDPAAAARAIAES